MIGIVLDTNVVISAHLNEEGLEAAVLDLVFTGELRVFASEPILEEYELTFARPKFGAIAPERVRQSLAELRKRATLIEPEDTLDISSHKADNRFLECAEASCADFLVTGNKRHYPQQWKNTRVVNAREFLEVLRHDETTELMDG